MAGRHLGPPPRGVTGDEDVVGNDMYDIGFDVAEKVLHIRASGFWTPDVLARFSQEVFARGAELRQRHGEFAVLTDARECPVQSGEVATGLMELSMRSASVNPCPNVMVVSSALVALQGRRVMIPSTYRIMTDYDEACRWLYETWTAQRAA